jgi:type I restriction enzyme, R subunit
MIGSEAPVQAKVVDFLEGLNWRPVSRKEMTELRAGRMGESLVEPLLVHALRGLNPDLSEQEALQVVDQLRRVPDAESFLQLLRDGLDIAFAAEEDARHVAIVDWRDPAPNSYVVTTEFELKTGAIREPRLDVVCLVNGIPLGLIETKAFKGDWREAVRDFRGYWADAPELERYATVCVATNGFRFRVAPSGATKVAQYAEWKDTWPHPMPDDGEHRELEVGLVGVLHPDNLSDLAANFVVWETRHGVTAKKLARYQQFRATKKVVGRVLEGEFDRGIVWHTQGSGKSLTMIFTARKLKNVGLGNPTIFIVIDRRDLDEQINETFTACSFEGVTRAVSREALRSVLAADKRGVVITTVQKFDESMGRLAGRDNVVVLVDEAHRTQEGVFGIRMREALPKAKLFAYTGTPIETHDRSTRRAFSPEIDGKYENYLDVYTPKQAVEDRATVEVRYEPRLVEMAHFKPKEVDAAFAAFAEKEGLGDEELEKLAADAARFAVVAKGKERVRSVAQDIAAYLHEHTIPQGFKAQLVAVDREACVLYAEELLRLGLQPDELAVIYTPNTKKDHEPLRRWYAREQWRRLHGSQAEEIERDLVVDEEAEVELPEVRARKQLIARFKDPAKPLKLLIVTDMLLTGFDAPIEQVMFLDKPLRGAKLLQAIMRTNRPYPEKDKDRGVIVDYWGVFERLESAFAEFSPDEVELAVFDLSELRERFPVLVAEALALVAGMPKGVSEYEQMMWLVGRFSDDKEATDLFEARFQAAQSAYESLAPEPSLAPHLDDYRLLVRLRALFRHGARLDQDGAFDVSDYRPQTHALVREAVSVERLRHDLPVYRIDGSYLERLEGAPGSPEEKAAEVETAIEYEIRERGEDDPLARSLAERLERLRRRKEEADLEMLDLLSELCKLARDWAGEKEAHRELGLSERAYGFVSIARANAPEGVADARLVELARRLDELVEANASFAEWAERDDVLRDIRREAIKLLSADEATRPLLATTFLDEALTLATARREKARST